MKKDVKKTLIITSIITALPILIGVVLWNRLPDISSKIRQLKSKGICINTNGTDPCTYRADPVYQFHHFFRISFTSWIIFCRSNAEYIENCQENWQANHCKPFTAPSIWRSVTAKMSCHGMSLMLGVMFLVIGNYLPKVKQNWYLGIKLPWTYADEENWNKTHRLAGKLWFVGGLLFILNFFLQIRGIELWLMIVLVLIPVIYSYLYSRKKNKEE